MLSSAVRFAENAAGVEKTLRLFQGFCTAAAGLSTDSPEATAFAKARSELALGRRYLRILKWHPSWSNAYRALNGDQAPLLKLLEVAKWSFLGLYYFLEMPTITNAMRATDYAWAHTLQLEASKCWFYAISASILICCYQLLISAGSHRAMVAPPEDASSTKESEKPTDTSKAEGSEGTQYLTICRQLLVDGCDLVIAGSSVGWISADEVRVGTAYVVSSAVAGQQLWERVQNGLE